MTGTANLKRTPLYNLHVDAGARMVEFGGWEMPVQYTSLLAEHRAVRDSAGLFDLSHMGEIYFDGPDAKANLQRLLTNDVHALAPGRAHYTFICNEYGGIVDDVILYRLEDRYLLVVNAGNIDKDREWIRSRLQGRVSLDDRSAVTALLAVQGPSAEAIVRELTDAQSVNIAEMPSFAASTCKVGGGESLLSRTGYTGEDGFEIYCDASDAERLWATILTVGEKHGIVPVGLGARDTLRLEARLPLYGNDLSDETTPLQAGLGFAVKLDQGEFIGRDVLVKEKETGPKQRLVGFIMQERGGAPRHGYRVFYGDEPVGEVTSGSFSPTLQKDIGMAYVPWEIGNPGTEIGIEIRNRKKTGIVHKGRFVQARTKKS